MPYINKKGEIDMKDIKSNFYLEILAIVAVAVLLFALVMVVKDAEAFTCYSGEKVYIDEKGYFTIEGNPTEKEREDSDKAYEERMKLQKESADGERTRNDTDKRYAHEIEIEIEKIRSGK